MKRSRRRSRRALPVALALLGILGRARPAPAQERIHRTYTVDDGLVQSQVISLLEDRDGFLWLGTYNGVSRFDGAAFASFPPPDGPPPGPVNAIEQGADGALYFATDHGLGIWAGGRFGRPPAASGLATGEVHAIAAAPDGSLYFSLLTAPRAGKVVRRRRDGSYAPVPLAGGPERPYALLAGRDGTLWIGTEREGLWAFRDGRPAGRWTTPAQGLPSPQVLALAEGPDGAVYAGTGRGIARHRAGTVAPLPGWPATPVAVLRFGRSGTLYAGTYLAGVLCGPPEAAPRQVAARHGLPVDRVNDLRETRGGTVYVGTDRGVSLYDRGLLADWTPDGAVYAGTARGLSVLRGGRFTTFDTRRGLPDDTVYCSLLDPAGRVYVSTDHGIALVDPAAPPGRPAVLRVLHRADGLPGDEGNLGACHRDAAGLFWFGTIGGAAAYDPAAEPPARQPPRIQITGLDLFGRALPLPPPGAVRAFDSRENYFTFSFAGIDLAAPHRVRYRYRLSGLDRGWIESERRSVQYTNLSPGDYRFEVQAASGGSPWSPRAALPFTILTPLWRRWWFLLGVALLAGGAAALLLAVRVRHLLALERLRTSLAADLHDHIGAGLTEIAILSEIAARREAAQPLPELSKMAETARQLVDLYLIFKEALNNSLRHSGCREIELGVAIAGRRLEVRLADDGRGLAPAGPGAGGDGLANMRARAARIGGRLTIAAAPGGGTEVRFSGPLRP